MREPKSPNGWRLGEHTGCHRLVERLENRCLVELCHGGEFLETELATQSRSNLKQAPAPRRQPPQPLIDYLSDSVGKLATPARLVQRSLERVLGLQQADDLAHEQWIALRLIVDRARDGLGHVSAGDCVDHRRRVNLG